MIIRIIIVVPNQSEGAMGVARADGAVLRARTLVL